MFALILRPLTALCALLACSLALAQGSHTIRLVVPFNPGGGSDLFARLIAPGMSRQLGQNVIVENRAGAGGIIGADFVSKAPPDGRTLLLSDSAAYSISPALYPNLPYKQQDLVPVVEAGRFANVLLVPAKSPFNSAAELIVAARKNPGQYSIASAGNGSSPHLTAERFQKEAGIKLVHVPYKGSGPAITDTIGGQVDMVFSGLPSVSEFLKSGQLRAIGIASAQRSPFAPDVPTLAESGVPGFESLISQGVFAPRGTPADIVDKVNAAVVALMSSGEMAERLAQLKVVPSKDGAAGYQAWLDGQSSAWSALIREANIKIE